MSAIDLFEALGWSVPQVLETACFSEVVAVPDVDAGRTAEATCAHVGFHGTPSGFLQFEADREAAITLTAGFLGLAESDPAIESFVELAVCELGNMICGRLLSVLHPYAKWKIDPPRTAKPASPSTKLTRRTFKVSGGHVHLSVRFGERGSFSQSH